MDITKLNREEKRDYDFERIVNYMEKKGGIAKTEDLLALGFDYRRILSFVEDGSLIRIKNGYYTTKYDKASEEDQIIRLFPDGYLTMESALYVHGYLRKRPYQWQIAVSKNTSKARFKIDYPSVLPYYTEASVLEIGASKAPFGSGEMGVYDKERTICDCLKYQEKMKRDDFKEGVWNYIMDPQKDVAALMLYARERKVTKKVQTMIGVWL